MREQIDSVVRHINAIIVLSLCVTSCYAWDTGQHQTLVDTRDKVVSGTTVKVFQFSSDASMPFNVKQSEANSSQFSSDASKPLDTSQLRAHHMLESNQSPQANEFSQSADRGNVLTVEPQDGAGSAAETSNDTTDPFFVTINDNKYYGGMETLYIKGHPSKVCHLLNPCLRVDGTILLPQWMVRYDELLEFHCGMQNSVKFSLPDTEPPARDIISHDLFGIETPMLHAPFFLEGIIPAIVSLEAAHRSLDEGLQRACYARSGRSCADFPQFRGRNMRPALFIDERAKLIDESKSWVRQFLRLMTPRNATLIKELYRSDIFSLGHGSRDLKCFRSVFLTKRSSARMPINSTLFSSLQIFRSHEIEKERRHLYVLKSSRELLPPQNQCTLNVTILNRKPDPLHPDRALGRYIPNIPQVRRELRKLANQDPRVDIRVHSMRLDGRSMRWHINAMQKTDLLIAGHGASLANMIFMRRGSSVLELQPFAYYPDTYRKIAARIAGMLYAKYIAKPDAAAFRACMNHYYPEYLPNHDKAKEILARFDRAAAAYDRSSTNTRWILLHSFNASLERVRTCAQMQRLDVYAKGLAERTFDLAKATCGIRGS